MLNAVVYPGALCPFECIRIAILLIFFPAERRKIVHIRLKTKWKGMNEIEMICHEMERNFLHKT